MLLQLLNKNKNIDDGTVVYPAAEESIEKQNDENITGTSESPTLSSNNISIPASSQYSSVVSLYKENNENITGASASPTGLSDASCVTANTTNTVNTDIEEETK